MEDSSPSKRSRRRFLADLLFVGGGLSAAALLAKSKFGGEALPPEPVTAGAVAPPLPEQPQEHPPMPGEPMPVQPDDPIPSCTKSPAPQPDGSMELPQEPKIEGKMVAPNPSGGARAPGPAPGQ